MERFTGVTDIVPGILERGLPQSVECQKPWKHRTGRFILTEGWEGFQEEVSLVLRFKP